MQFFLYILLFCLPAKPSTRPAIDQKCKTFKMRETACPSQNTHIKQILDFDAIFKIPYKQMFVDREIDFNSFKNIYIFVSLLATMFLISLAAFTIFFFVRSNNETAKNKNKLIGCLIFLLLLVLNIIFFGFFLLFTTFHFEDEIQRSYCFQNTIASQILNGKIGDTQNQEYFGIKKLALLTKNFIHDKNRMSRDILHVSSDLTRQIHDKQNELVAEVEKFRNQFQDVKIIDGFGSKQKPETIKKIGDFHDKVVNEIAQKVQVVDYIVSSVKAINEIISDGGFDRQKREMVEQLDDIQKVIRSENQKFGGEILKIASFVNFHRPFFLITVFTYMLLLTVLWAFQCFVVSCNRLHKWKKCLKLLLMILPLLMFVVLFYLMCVAILQTIVVGTCLHFQAAMDSNIVLKNEIAKQGYTDSSQNILFQCLRKDSNGYMFQGSQRQNPENDYSRWFRFIHDLSFVINYDRNNYERSKLISQQVKSFAEIASGGEYDHANIGSVLLRLNNNIKQCHKFITLDQQKCRDINFELQCVYIFDEAKISDCMRQNQFFSTDYENLKHYQNEEILLMREMGSAVRNNILKKYLKMGVLLKTFHDKFGVVLKNIHKVRIQLGLSKGDFTKLNDCTFFRRQSLKVQCV